LWHLGEFASAREHLEQGIALYDRQAHRSHAFLYSQDPGVVCLAYLAFALWCLGYPEQALKRSHEAVSWAQELSHPFSQAIALNYDTIVHQFRRQGPATQERAKAVIDFSTKQGFPLWLAGGTILRGWALAEQGCEAEGIAQIDEGWTAWQAAGAVSSRPYFLALQAEAYGKMAQPEEGLTLLAKALAVMDKSRERWWEAELCRLKGELLLAQGAAEAEVEACFRRAINVARRQQAKSLELRAVMSLCRLYQKQGRPDETRQMLAEIYGWFTEGFDTLDLKEAKVLLKVLS
jgi:predicted ATPase